MNFFLDMIPPTVTAQEHKVMIRRGRPVFYDTPRLKPAGCTSTRCGSTGLTHRWRVLWP